MNITLELDSKQYKDLTRYCELNKLVPEDIVKKSYLEGFSIEKYGLLGNMGGIQEKRVEIEVIREKRVEIPVEVIKEVVKIEYVEVPVEVIKEVFVEVPVEKEVVKEVVKQVPVETIVTKIEYISDKTSENELLLKIQQLEQEFSTKTTEIGIIREEFSTITTEMENIFQDKMSKKDEELDRLRQELDKQLDRQPIEKIVEVVVEKEITDNSLKPKMDALQNTVQKLKLDNIEKDKKIKELESAITDIQKFQENKPAVYLKGSNLDNKLYK
jgi:Tfp pilus assembly protein PilP